MVKSKAISFDPASATRASTHASAVRGNICGHV